MTDATSEDNRSLTVKQQPAQRGGGSQKDRSSVSSKDTKSTSDRSSVSVSSKDTRSTSDSSVVDLKMELAVEISKFIAEIEYQLDHVVPMAEICFVRDSLLVDV